jgi:hypothetical protein
MAKMDGGLRLAVAAEATKDEQLRRRRYADAAVLLRQAPAEDSSLAQAHVALGCALFNGEADIDGAEAAWRAAIEFKFGDPFWKEGLASEVFPRARTRTS